MTNQSRRLGRPRDEQVQGIIERISKLDTEGSDESIQRQVKFIFKYVGKAHLGKEVWRASKTST